MKRVLIILGIIVALVIVLLFLAPILFKSQIVDMAKSQANKQVNATINFEDVGLSLFKNFPELTASVEKMTVINSAPFEGDTLVYLEEFQATLNLFSLIGGNVEILSISLVGPRVNLIVAEDSTVNWDIVPVDTSVTAADTDAAAAFSMAIKQYEVSNASIMYTDRTSNMVAEISGLNHTGMGDFDQAVFTLSTHTYADNFTFKMEDIPYLNKAELEIDADIDMDMQNSKYTFKENEIRLNQLYLNFDGWLAMPNENDIDMDISFAAQKAEFKNILSMVPVIYMKDFGELEADGQLTLNGKINGRFNEQVFPKFDINLGVQNGMFQYPELPTPVKNVGVDLNIKSPSHNLDDMVVNLKRFHLEILNEPIDFKLMVKTPISDPFIDANFVGKVNLAEVKNVIPFEQEMELTGMINTDFRFQGKMSDIENQRANKLTVTGNVKASGIKYTSEDMPEPIEVSSADLRMTAYNASLNKFNMKMGKSDISANGGLDNIVGYVLSDQTLKGTLNVKSNYFDLSPWMAEDSAAMAASAEDTLMLVAIEVPAKVEFVMTADFKKIKMDNIDMSNARGKLVIKDQAVQMVDLRGDLLSGNIVSNGTYKYIAPAPPKIDFDLKLTDLSIAESYSSFVTVQRLAPLAKYIKGTLSGTVEISADLGDSLMPVLETLNSRGALKITNAQILGLEGLNNIADKIKIKELRDPRVKNLHPSYKAKDGRCYVDPVTFEFAGYKATASGSNAITYDMNGDLDYKVTVEMPSDKLAGYVEQLNLFKGANLSERLQGKITLLPISVGGTMKSPKVSLDMQAVSSSLGKQVTDILKEEAEKKKKELEQKAKDEIEKKVNEGVDKLKDLFKK